MEPSVTLSPDDIEAIAQQVETLVIDRLQERAIAERKYYQGMTDEIPGIRAVVKALIRNYRL